MKNLQNLFLAILVFISFFSCTKEDPTPTTTTTGCYPATTLNITSANETSSNYNDTILSDTIMVLIPQYFTPNGDGVNDFFYISSKQFKQGITYSLTITDNCSTKVFESHDYLKGWDGTYQGKSATKGIYNYTFSCIISGKALSKTKKVQLIRF